MKYCQLFLISVLLAFCTACSDAEKIENQTPEISEREAPGNLGDINPAFHDVQIIHQEGKDILTANFHALTPAANTLARQEFEMANFFNDLRNYFPDVKPDIVKLTYYGLLEEQLGAIFSVEFDMTKLEHIPDFTVAGIHILDYSSSFTKFNAEQAQEMIFAYCNESISLDSRTCKLYAD